jgi:hypothetical protein
LVWSGSLRTAELFENISNRSEMISEISQKQGPSSILKSYLKCCFANKSKTTTWKKSKQKHWFVYNNVWFLLLCVPNQTKNKIVIFFSYAWVLLKSHCCWESDVDSKLPYLRFKLICCLCWMQFEHLSKL